MSERREVPLPIRWRKAVREEHRLSTRAKAVAAALSDYMDNTTGRCWPTVERIGRDLSYSPRSVKYGLAELKEAGYLEVERKRNQPSRKIARFPATKERKVQRVAPSKRQDGRKVQRVAPRKVQPVARKLFSNSSNQLDTEVGPPPKGRDIDRERYAAAADKRIADGRLDPEDRDEWINEREASPF